MNNTRETRRTSDQVILLEAATTQTNNRLSDNLVFQLGTSRRAELIGVIGDNGKPYQAVLNDYIDGL